MIPKFFPNSSMRIRTTSNSSSKQSRKSIIKQQISSLHKNQKIEEKTKNQKTKANCIYLLDHSKDKQNDINFVAQKVLNPLNFHGKKRLVLNNHNSNISKQKRQNFSRRSEFNVFHDIKEELYEIRKQEQKKYQPESFKQHQKPPIQASIRRNLKLSSFIQNRKISQQKQKYSKFSYSFQFNIQIKPKKTKKKIALLDEGQHKLAIQRDITKYQIIQNNINIKIIPQLNQQKKQSTTSTTNSECQTYIGYLEQKYIGEFARLRQLKKKSYQSFQDHYIKLQKLGNSNQLYQQRQQCLKKYLCQGPQNQREKRVFQLKKKMNLRQDKIHQLFQQFMNKKQTKIQLISQTIQAHSSKFTNTTQSIQTLLKVISNQLQIQDKNKQKRLIQRIQRQVDHFFQINQKFMNEVSEILDNMLNTQNLQRQWKLSQQDYVQNVMLIRNCAKRLLQINKTAYELFGEPKTNQFVEDEAFKALSFHERYDKLIQKKCQDCIIINPKVRMLQAKNKKAMPYIKVLNQLLRQNQKNFFFQTEIIEKQSEEQMRKKRVAIQQIQNQVKLQYFKMTNTYIY